jgi:hypothetical protein
MGFSGGRYRIAVRTDSDFASEDKNKEPEDPAPFEDLRAVPLERELHPEANGAGCLKQIRLSVLAVNRVAQTEQVGLVQ